MWCAGRFAGEQEQQRWAGPVRGALRLLADSGLGGGRSLGWGRSAPPEFVEESLPQLLLRGTEPQSEHADEKAFWLLSLFTPAADDLIDWRRGNYALVKREGCVESATRSGELKKTLKMVAEGSVLVAREKIRGAAANVAPDGFPHPVFRAGFAFAIPLPVQPPS